MKLDKETCNLNSEVEDANRIKTQEKKVKILHLENVGGDAELINNVLKDSKLHYETVVVETMEKFLKELKVFSPDIILANHSLPLFNSHEALTILSENGLKVPFMVVTAALSEEHALDLIGKGADDYILKDRLRRMPVAIRNLLEKYHLKSLLKAGDDELVSSQSELKEALAIAHLGNWELDYSTGVAIWSEQQLRIYGLPPKNERQSYQIWTSFIHQEDLDYVIRATKEAKLTSGKANFFYRIIRTDGTVRHLYSQVRTKFNTAGCSIGLHGVTQDVTDARMRENEFQQSQLNLHAIFENGSDGFILADTNGIIKSFNSRAKNETRLNTKQEMEVGKLIVDFLPGGTLGNSQILSVLSGKTIQFDYPYTQNNRQTKWFSFTVNPVCFAEKIEGISITLTDITDRKKAEQQLIESELFNKAILDTISSHIAVIDNTGNIIAVNKAWNDFAIANRIDSLEGLSVGCNCIEVCRSSMAAGDTVAGQTLEGIYSVFNKEIKSFEIEYPCHSLTEERWFLLCVVNLSYTDSKTVITLQNITERKKTELKLQKSELKYRQIVETAQEGIWMIDEDDKTIFVNQKMCEIIGYSSHEMIGKTNLFFKDNEGLEMAKIKLQQRRQGISETYHSSLLQKMGD